MPDKTFDPEYKVQPLNGRFAVLYRRFAGEPWHWLQENGEKLLRDSSTDAHKEGRAWRRRTLNPPIRSYKAPEQTVESVFGECTSATRERQETERVGLGEAVFGVIFAKGRGGSSKAVVVERRTRGKL